MKNNVNRKTNLGARLFGEQFVRGGSPNALEMRSFLSQLEYRKCQVNLRMRLIRMQQGKESAERPRNEVVPAKQLVRQSRINLGARLIWQTPRVRKMSNRPRSEVDPHTITTTQSFRSTSEQG